MKVYIDLQKLAISKVVDATSPEYQGDINSNVFEILFFNFSGTNWFPTMSQLAPNGREAGDFEADALEESETHDYTEDGVSYKRYTFTMGDTWVLMKGRSNFFVWYNVLEGSTLKKCVGKLNVMINESSNTYFISNPLFNPSVKNYIDGEIGDLEDELNDKIDEQNATIASLSQASPSVFDTAANIQLLQENKGVAVATDTGYIWYWDTTITPNAYVSSGLQYNSLANYTKHSGNQLQDANGNNFYPDISQSSDYLKVKTILDIDNIQVTFTSGSMINSYDLSTASNPYYSISNVIHITPHTRIKGYTFTNNNSISIITSCDSNGNRLKSTLKGQSNAVVGIDIYFEDEAYIEVCVYNSNYQFYLYTDTNTSITNELSNITNTLNKSLNLFDVSKISAWGSWCNYTNGNIESNQYVTTYAYSEYIEVEPSTEYSRVDGTWGVVFFDSNKNYISGTNTGHFTTPSNCKYLIMNVTNTTRYYLEMLIKTTVTFSQASYTLPHYIEYGTPMDRGYVVIGSYGDFTTIKDGFAYAVKNNLNALILPETFDLVSEGITGTGYLCPKKIIGYGATLTCVLDSEDWNLSPLNVIAYSSGVEIYGLTIICENCRYCIHDEMGTPYNSQFYHNIYKDLHLVHKSNPSSVLIGPQCIGGGCGDKGYIEIDNCIFEAKIRDVSYHSLASAPQRNQSGDCIIKCTNSIFSHAPTISAIGTGTSYMNIMYVSNCLLGEALVTTPQTNFKMIAWNNQIGS